MSYAGQHRPIQPVRVLIVDEKVGLDARMRAGLEHAPSLRTLDEDELAGCGPEPAVALIAVDGAEPEAGCARILRLREGRPWLRVLVMIQALGAAAMQRMIDAGADAFVGAGSPAETVCATVLALAQTVPSNARPGAEGDTSDNAGLTPREAEVLRFLSAGFSNKEVARRLSLSVRTVETHRLNLRRKTQTGRLKDLVTLARQLGLDPIHDAEGSRDAARHAALA